ncbi:MAG: hypothetical protein LBL90_00115 [Prevotellaceae bacterium]|jgi:hypothetical protein|nr:hypothetical protein [Prevotellaceae bacterium]
MINPYHYTTLNSLISSYIPVFIPVGFIILYLSVVLALKRIRSLTDNLLGIVFSVIINYLLIASFIAISKTSHDSGADLRHVNDKCNT